MLFCVSAVRSRRIWLSLRLSLPAKKSTDASSRDNRYPESLAVTSNANRSAWRYTVVMATSLNFFLFLPEDERLIILF